MFALMMMEMKKNNQTMDENSNKMMKKTVGKWIIKLIKWRKKKEIIDIIGNQIQESNKKTEENGKQDKHEIMKKIDEIIKIYSEETKKMKEEICTIEECKVNEKIKGQLEGCWNEHENQKRKKQNRSKVNEKIK